MATRPNIVVHLGSRQSVNEFRAGIGDVLGVTVLGPETASSYRLAGVDALYLSLIRAERFGSRPIPEHTVATLRTSVDDQEEGFPPFVFAGLLLGAEDRDSPEYGLPILMKALLEAVAVVNRQTPGAIRTIGFFEHELTFKGSTHAAVAKLFVESIVAAG